MIKIKVNG